MVTALLDTSIVVDLLRDYLPAKTWYLGQTEPLGISRAVWWEVIEGVQDKKAQEKALRLMHYFELVDLITQDMMWASQHLLIYHLSHNIDIFDCLIGASAIRLGYTLYTRNLKHFGPLIGVLAVAPY